MHNCPDFKLVNCASTKEIYIYNKITNPRSTEYAMKKKTQSFLKDGICYSLYEEYPQNHIVKTRCTGWPYEVVIHLKGLVGGFSVTVCSEKSATTS